MDINGKLAIPARLKGSHDVPTEPTHAHGHLRRLVPVCLAWITLVVLLAYGPVVYALQVTLAWDPPASGTVDGYHVFSRLAGQSYNYSQPAWQGSATTCTLSSLQDTTTYFVVRAYNSSGESADSNEATYQPAGSTPAISLSTSSLSASGTQGANAMSQSFQVSNSGGGTLSYTISDNASWLSCSPTSGTSTGASNTVTLSYATSGLTAGTYSATITIAATGASNSPQAIPVTLTVSAAATSAATISRSPTSLSPACVQGANAVSQTFQVWNSGSGTLSYTISDNVGWLSCNVTSGTSTGTHKTVTVTYATSTLGPGTYSGTITISASGVSNSPQTIPVTLKVVASDLSPAKPMITSPYTGQMECDPLLTVQTQPFSDPDAGDSHSMSRWQISTADDFTSLVLDISTTTRLTALPVPHSTLDRATTYFARVRFFDAVGAASEWSDAVEFRTISTIVDADQDGVPDSHEVGSTVDLNGDGIPDDNQPELIKDAKTALGNNVAVGVCKDSDSIVEIETLDTINPATILDKTNRPSDLMYGLVTYRVRVETPGSTATVTLYFSSDISSAQGYYVYDTVNGWQDYAQHATFNADGRSVTVELQDGGFGDSDGIANGVIVDPGGVVTIASGGTGTASSSGSGGGGGGCFIATAASECMGEHRQLILSLGMLVCLALLAYVARIRR